MIPEDQQSYIRSMSLCTLKKSKVNRGLETRSCLESLRHARIKSGLFCSTFWADLKTLRIIRESQTSDMPLNSDPSIDQILPQSNVNAV
ncbi:hypothetical protein AVEN_218210-1 [Araneus ventricosus]|uniref:Uncharacterized protein n=1 Tax=Araneus ventricosus TaxID=182803 RepID=A0A4Y2N2G2_ARAVE|nr:hypothetical protein AVEN_51701-1 [Araneus ventricosus]GBN32046.1 hypothetical protein AVEN_218210-1 [Araneus ventricosus]